MESDIAYFVTYSCPQCHLELESQHGGWEGWLRCPSCGTPSMPPEILLGHPATMRRIREAGEGNGDVLVIGDEESTDTDDSDPAAAIGPPASPVLGTLRLVFLSGLLMSLFVLLIAYLDDNQVAMSIFGGLAFLFFLLIFRIPARRRRLD